MLALLGPPWPTLAPLGHFQGTLRHQFAKVITLSKSTDKQSIFTCKTLFIYGVNILLKIEIFKKFSDKEKLDQLILIAAICLKHFTLRNVEE